MLLFAYDDNAQWKSPLQKGISSGIQDVSIVATHIMLAAKELGVDSVWCDYFPNDKTQEIFSLPENEKVVLLMPLGYADPSCTPNVRHEMRKDLSEIVKKI